uniref:Uncharacterized protein n=1 Tax=Strongyloides stercoralis TaxID=6248 RepID=A0AAF5DGV6_STRER
MAFYISYFLFYIFIIFSILLSLFALIHNNWYIIGNAKHPIGLFGGCINHENLMNTNLTQILNITIVIILTIIKHIVSSSYKGSWGTSVVIIFTLSLAIKFFNLCIIKFGRKQIYTFYNYTKKSTCVDGCLEYFDDGLPFFKLGNSYFIEILSIFLLIFSLSLFLLYLYRKEIHSRRGIQTVQDTLTINDITRPPSNGEFLIQNNNDYLNQG